MNNDTNKHQHIYIGLYTWLLLHSEPRRPSIFISLSPSLSYFIIIYRQLSPPGSRSASRAAPRPLVHLRRCETAASCALSVSVDYAKNKIK